MILLMIFVEAIVKVLLFAIGIHLIYLAIVKISIKKDSQDILGGLVAKLFNDWLDVVQYYFTGKHNKNLNSKSQLILDRKYKLMLSIHLLPASLVTALIWQYLLQAVLIINGIFLFLIIFSTTQRN